MAVDQVKQINDIYQRQIKKKNSKKFYAKSHAIFM